MKKSILLAGVGGQGILLAAKIIAGAAENAGYEVCSNEIHGMAQRGGSVTAMINFGDKIYSPLIPEGGADILAALEEIEALRYAHFLKAGGFAAVSAQKIIPVTVSSGVSVYPDDVEERLKRVFPYLIHCDCPGLACGLGNARLANTILLGVLSRALPLSGECWRRSIENSVKPQFIEKNMEAFETGKNFE